MIDSERALRKSRNQLTEYQPYPKQREFHALGAENSEVLCMAANQSLKTYGGSREFAIHMTGKYPEWWVGRRFDHPIRAMAGSESSELTRKGVQRLLLGIPEDESTWGTGAIPYADIVSYARKQGVPNTVDNIVVKHYDAAGKHDGNSTVQFSSYDQGRGKWAADTIDLVWFDEEPPEDVYIEGVTRTNATHGYVMVTATPVLGMSSVIMRFYPRPMFPRCAFVLAGIKDAMHYTEEERAQIIAKYPLHERDARAYGIPQFGSGRVFTVAEEMIRVEAFGIPQDWPQICGLDFGWDHPSAGVRLAWDKDNDVLYVMAAHRAREQTPALFAPAVRAWGDWLPWAWPHDGLQHDKGSGIQLATQYRSQGLDMLPDRATHAPAPGQEEGEGGNGVEAGITEMLDRMQTGRLKVFAHLNDWWEEFRMYHRKDGLIVKVGDDLMSATRYGIMMRRFARQRIQKRREQPRYPSARSAQSA